MQRGVGGYRQPDLVDVLVLMDIHQPAISLCSSCGIRLNDTLVKTHVREVVRARHGIWVMMHAKGAGISQIARVFGVDHSTVFYAIKGRKPKKAVAA